VELKDKVVVITGASAGIGAETARELAKAGARLVLTARRGDRLQELADELPVEAAFLAADIADPATPEHLLKLAIERFGRADAVINNAGLLAVASIEAIDLDQITQLIRVNYEAVVRSSYVFARAFKAQGAGAIVNVSSIGAHTIGPMMGVYSGTKSAVEGFTDALRIELAGTGVKVGAIAPGSTETDMLDAIRTQFGQAGPPPTPMLGPDDVAQAVRFMLEQSDRSNIVRLLIYSAHETY
jgi:NADP-dependent 3-hydroxy acid dehydrogenase YdfG